MKKYWTTATGERIPISGLKDSHLLNIIAMIDRYSENGWIIRYGYIGVCGGDDGTDMFYDEDILYGKDVHDYFEKFGSYKALIKEKKKRKLLLKGESKWLRKKIQKSQLVK